MVGGFVSTRAQTRFMLGGNIMKHVLTALACALLFTASARAAEPFRLTSPAFPDNGVLSKKYGGISPANKNCTGENVSLPLAWTRGPEGTRSYVLTLVDLAGRMGTGVDHWVAYGIPADVTMLAEGAHSAPKPFIVGGKSGAETEIYFGPCPAPGTGLHHYVVTLVATDLEPDALKPGLTRADVLKAIAGHGKAVTDMVLRMEYAP